MPSATAKKLENNIETILVAWEKRALVEIKAAEDEEKLILRDTLPDYLTHLVEALSKTNNTSTSTNLANDNEAGRTGRAHGKDRADNDLYSMDQMIEEYHILRQVIFDTLEEDGKLVNAPSREIIISSIEQAVNDAATEYMRVTTSALERLSLQLSKIADAVPVHIMQISDKEKFVFANSAVAALWGLSLKELIGKNVKDVVGDELYSVIKPHIDKVLSGDTVSFEGRITLQNEIDAIYQYTYTPEKDKDGVTNRFIVTGVEITQRKQSEEVLRKNIKALDQEKELRERITGALTHDLRTPITAAKIASQMILRKPADVENSMNKSNLIIKSLDRVDKMITDILDASRIKGTVTSELSFQPLDLEALTKSVVDDLNNSYANKVVLKSQGKCDGFWNEDALRRALENLVTNGIKYGVEDFPVTVSLTQEESIVVITIHNEGNPIPSEEQSVLFDKFKRSESAKHKIGWGLGLSVVKSMVDAHLGEIIIESSEDSGTNFIVKLPKNPGNVVS